MITVSFYIITSDHPDAIGMKYIGVTAGTLEDRWATHIRHAKPDSGRNGAFQQAIRAHGAATFKIALLEEGMFPDNNHVDHRELELILQHDAIRQGWNRYTSSRKGTRKTHPRSGTVPERWERVKALVPRIEKELEYPGVEHQVLARHLLRSLKLECDDLVRMTVDEGRERRRRKGLAVHPRKRSR